MSDKMIAQEVTDAGFPRRVPCTQASAGTMKAPVAPAEFGRYSFSHTIRIRYYEPGCFP